MPDSAPNTIFIQAPAKVNLALAVGRAEPAPSSDSPSNSLHPICSWMVGVSLYDDLTLTALEADRFSRYSIDWHEEALRRSDIDWSITKDLAVRAHLLLEEIFGKALPVQLRLQKRIPVGGGLGGGSSDAAAMLIGCNRLFDLGLSDDELINVASRIGSDVPFFIEAKSAIVEGFGEQISKQPVPEELHLVLCFPEEVSNTGEVYRQFDEVGNGDSTAVVDLSTARQTVHHLCNNNSIAGQRDAFFNDLAEAAYQQYPALRSHKDRLHELTELPVHMSGSGSTLFLVCDNAVHAECIVEAVNEQLSDLPCVAVTHPQRACDS